MHAVLWDGYKQINGELEMEDTQLHFKMTDFAETDLHLEIPYDKIKRLTNRRIYGIEQQAIAIYSDFGKVNVFVVDDQKSFKKNLETILLINQSKSEK